MKHRTGWLVAPGVLMTNNHVLETRGGAATSLVEFRYEIDLTATEVQPVQFRLEPGERRRATERALSPGECGVPAETLRQLKETLEPGAAIVAVLLEHEWAHALHDAVARTDGVPLANEFVDATTLGDLAPDLLAAATR